MGTKKKRKSARRRMPITAPKFAVGDGANRRLLRDFDYWLWNH
jgi:hypothetical protein